MFDDSQAIQSAQSQAIQSAQSQVVQITLDQFNALLSRVQNLEAASSKPAVVTETQVQSIQDQVKSNLSGFVDEIESAALVRVEQLENVVLMLLKVTPIENGDVHSAAIAANKTA